MKSQVKLITIDAPNYILYKVPLVNPYKAFKKPEPEVVEHILTKNSNFILLNEFGLYLLLIGLFIHY